MPLIVSIWCDTLLKYHKLIGVILNCIKHKALGRVYQKCIFTYPVWITVITLAWIHQPVIIMFCPIWGFECNHSIVSSIWIPRIKSNINSRSVFIEFHKTTSIHVIIEFPCPFYCTLVIDVVNKSIWGIRARSKSRTIWFSTSNDIKCWIDINCIILSISIITSKYLWKSSASKACLELAHSK